MSFRTALSGLNAAAAELNVISNNIANSSTTGFKSSRAEFGDIYAATSTGSSGISIGSGVRLAAVAQQFGQGNIGFTQSNMDLAINGQGFFRLDDNGTIVYSRAGSFGIDREGYVVNPTAQKLTAFQADAAGNITGALGTLQLSTADIAPSATAGITIGMNLNAAAPVPLAPVTSSTLALSGTQTLRTDGGGSPFTTTDFTLVDSYGNSITNASLRYTYSGAGNIWGAELLVGGASTTPPTTSGTTTTGIDIGTTTSVTLNWDPDGTGAQGTVPLTMNTTGLTQVTGAGASDIAVASNGNVQGAFSPSAASSYNNSTSTTIYDSLGTSHLATMYYRKTGTPNVWESYLYIDGNAVDSANTLGFSNTGDLASVNGAVAPPNAITYSAYNPGNGAATIALTLDYTETKQFGSAFGVNSLTQNGYTTGRLSGVNIDSSGIVFARYSNGQSKALGQIALTNFSNPQGLQQLGNTNWAETFQSGSALTGSPGTASLGLIQAGALEGSNVDLTEQLVNMITSQRNFQANAQVISTNDSITQAVINIRR
ncbi:MAG: flagellar hook protein FlgE [Gammaproteobacteria bacterium]|nr:flagellar hook protein FlgE [Gammaproteobacteria bacterium]